MTTTPSTGDHDGADADPSPARLRELEAALGGVRRRIAAAAAGVGRDPSTVTLVAVTKTFPAADVVALARLGVTDVGENRDQEARPKRDAVTAGSGGTGTSGLRWHLVGQLQTNKARSVAGWAHAVHSVDRARLVTALSRAVAATDRSGLPGGPDLQVFLQVSLDGDPDRGGALPADVPALADAVAEAPGLALAGVMAVAPREADPGAAFAALAAVGARVREAHPGATGVSAGMSGDLEAAIAQGATHVRVGSALLGTRPPAVD